MFRFFNPASTQFLPGWDDKQIENTVVIIYNVPFKELAYCYRNSASPLVAATQL